jgi:hypothetical protein
MFCIIMLGQGGRLTCQGTLALAKKIEALDIEVEILQHYEYIEACQLMQARDPGELLIIGGTSLGASTAVLACQYYYKAVSSRKIEYCFGIQPSNYGANVGYTSNILQARCIWNPSWWLTLGFGNRKLLRNIGNKMTEVTYQPSSLPHPGDYAGSVHNSILADIEGLL